MFSLNDNKIFTKLESIVQWSTPKQQMAELFDSFGVFLYLCRYAIVHINIHFIVFQRAIFFLVFLCIEILDKLPLICCSSVQDPMGYHTRMSYGRTDGHHHQKSWTTLNLKLHRHLALYAVRYLCTCSITTIFLIHSANPKSRPVGIIVCPSVPTFQI